MDGDQSCSSCSITLQLAGLKYFWSPLQSTYHMSYKSTQNLSIDRSLETHSNFKDSKEFSVGAESEEGGCTLSFLNNMPPPDLALLAKQSPRLALHLENIGLQVKILLIRSWCFEVFVDPDISQVKCNFWQNATCSGSDWNHARWTIEHQPSLVLYSLHLYTNHLVE